MLNKQLKVAFSLSFLFAWLWLLQAGPALPDEAVAINTSQVKIEPHHEAWAEVTFTNLATNNAMNNGGYSVTLEGVQIPFTFQWDWNPQGYDRVVLEPPPEYMCIPRCDMAVQEATSQSILLYLNVGM